MIKTRIAIVPGSFDPITNGHVDIIRRAAEDYDKVYVAVMINSAKQYLFTMAQRKGWQSLRFLILQTWKSSLRRECFGSLPNPWGRVPSSRAIATKRILPTSRRWRRLTVRTIPRQKQFCCLPMMG